MAMQPERRRNLLIFLVTIPFWTNLLVRNYAWILLLRNGGLVEGLLHWLGLSDQPLGVMYPPVAVSIGLTYSYLPFMVLPIYARLEKLDARLLEAAFDPRANRRRALTPGVLPGSGPRPAP